MDNKLTNPILDEIWSLIKETQKNLKEASASHKKEMREIRASHKEAKEEMREIRASHKEAKEEMREIRASHKEAKEEMREIRASHKEAKEEMREKMRKFHIGMEEIRAIQKETAEEIKESNKRFEKTRNLFETQWGRLVESLIEGKLVEMLKTRGIAVRQTCKRVELSYTTKAGKTLMRELDILAVNGTEAVAVEVKTTLTPDKVKYFLTTLKDFKKYFPDHQSKTIYGAVAFLRSESQAHLFAQRQGLFVIKATGDSSRIINTKDFKPKAFS